MLAIAILLYSTIRKQVYKQIDNSLLTEKTIIQDQVEQTGLIPDFNPTFGHQIEVRLLDVHVEPVQVLKDTIIKDTTSKASLPFRHLFFAANRSGDKGYTIIILRSLNERDNLLADIGFYMFFLFLSLFLISIVLNYIISRNLWEPFYKTVDAAEKFDIQSDKPLALPETNINEFRQLNTVFSRMTKKIRDDYISLKEYNENAAHEIRTPLAVIRSKTELLMQKKELGKDSLNIIRSINEATTRLFKLTKSLLMISRIENLYFRDEKELSLKKIIENNIMNYREIIQLKKITVELKAENPAMVKMNETLADMLISNLFSNAVRYNIDGGFIKCLIQDGVFSISNSGLPLKTDPGLLFRRFHRSGDNPQSIGLGLSIVKKITDIYNMEITYTFRGNIHELNLAWSGNEID
jgi:signal transduction histidine kinase